MNKKYTYGTAALVLTGATLLGSSLYAANIFPKMGNAFNRGNMQMHGGPESVLATLSGSVSPEALSEFTTLMDFQKAKMEALKGNGSGSIVDKTTVATLMKEHQAALAALMKKYPELETALKNLKGKGGGFGMDAKGGIETALTGLPEEAKTKIQSIRESYVSKFSTLKDQEEAEVLALLDAYPDIKEAYQKMLENRENISKQGHGMNWGNREHRGEKQGNKRAEQGKFRGMMQGMMQGNNKTINTENAQ